MKIAVSSHGKDLNSQINPRFGRCEYFLIVNTDDMSFEAIENKGASLSGGAGIEAALLVISKGAKAVITDNCGPKAAQTLSSAGVDLLVDYAGTVKDAIEKYKSSDLTSTKKAKSEPAEYIQRPSFDRGLGMGAGGGSGRRGGRGGGGGRRGLGGSNRGSGR
ncbi:MAG: NifB/NifX family molybdenum-iron cluster-binding protein [Proteobacteria bacterium]|nr:NifB/NifX family molybdenum-iron cluster-binding protein [Pseudomonadota bacterium]MBU4286607.1 NifB/NifX family molybdenum-iron cluster-binding protein [Pseudomonadota bacterium]MBU4415562.1 NifB/NifX family molybdenum-iron cluster-binding protein [Pseudomonadota bacterium]